MVYEKSSSYFYIDIFFKYNISDHEKRGLIDLENSRDVWLNYLLNFLYREFCHSDLLHDFVLRKIKVELDELHKGPANRILSKLEIKDYEFGSHCPIIKNIKQTEPEGN